CLVQFLEIAKSLENDDVHSAFQQGRNLLAEGVFGLLKRSLSQWLNPNSQRAHRPSHPGVEALRRFLCQSGASEIDVTHFAAQSVALEPEAIATKGVGLNDLRSRLQIFMMNSADQVRLRQVQLVVAAVDENSLRIEQRAHRAITKDG